MKILYLDLNDDKLIEDYSIKPKRYGGGRVFASWAKFYEGFYLAGNPKCFENFNETDNEAKDRLIPLVGAQRMAIMSGHPLINILPQAASFDIVIHHNATINVNLEGSQARQVVWPVGYSEDIHPNIENVFLFNSKTQQPRIVSGSKHVFYKTTIGVDIPEFREYQKRDYLFLCSRQTKSFLSIEIAKICQYYGIPMVFAGKIDDDCDLLNHIDNKTTFFLGEISQEEKEEHLKYCRAVPFLHSWQTSFSLAAIEAQSFGCPVISTKIGWWNDYLKEGTNGYFATNNTEFLYAYQNAHEIKQKDCYDAAAPYNVQAMIDSYFGSFFEILGRERK